MPLDTAPALPDTLASRPAGGTPAQADADAAVWRLRVLGRFELDDGRHCLTRLRSRAAMVLLARLAMAPQRDHGRDELAALLWPEADQESGRNRLRQTLSLLRAVLEPPGRPAVLLADRRVLRAVPGALWCDAVAFERAWRHAPAAQAQALYAGELLPGFYDEWVLEERQRLQALADRLAGPVPAAPALPDAAASGASARLPHYPTRLIGAQAQAARLLALSSAQRLVSVLGPGGAGKTRLAVEVARLACIGPPVHPPQGGQAGLDIDQAVFVTLVGAFGRSELLDRLQMALRLEGASDAMEQLQGALQGRATLLVLDNAEQLHDDAAQTISALLEQLPLLRCLVTTRRELQLPGEHVYEMAALQLPPPAASLDAVAANDAVALFVDRARAHRPDFHVSTGNQAALSALVRWLDGLPLAIELAASQSRTLDPGELLALLRAARDGAGDGEAPSANAAAGTLEPTTSGTTAAASSLAFLTRRGARSGSDTRQASMLAVIAWSWHLLTQPQQRLLSSLSLLPAGATLQTAAALAGTFAPAPPGEVDALAAQLPPATPAGRTPSAGEMLAAQNLLNQLMASSVLRSNVGVDGLRRYLPLEPVREFALAQLSADTLRRARGRLLAWLLDWAAALPATPPLPTVREELPNLLQALARAPGDGNANAAMRLVLTLQSSWGEIALPHSALQVLDALLATPGLDDSLAAAGHAMAAWCWYEAGQRDAARPHLQAAFERPCSDPALQVMVLSRGARMHWRLDADHQRARALIAQALPLARAVGRANSEASLLSLQAHLCTVIDRDHAQARALSAQALALWQRSGNRHLINAGRYNVAVNTGRAGRWGEVLEELQSLADEGLALQDWDLASGALEARGTGLLALRRWDEALADLHRSLAVGWEGSQMVAVMYALWNVAPVLARRGHGELAAATMGLCEAQWPLRCGSSFDRSDRRDLKRMRRFARALLGPAGAQAAWQRGAATALSDGVRGVLALG